ncbi:MAG: ribosome biogenesis GTP-binding protein YihA/YsxC [Thermoanaerobaculia bacterium]
MRIESGEFIRAAFSEKDFLRDGRPEIAFVGRSNVGKSSLLNRLLGRRALARISSQPGRTQAVNYFLINSNLYFVDLPGYGYAKVGKAQRQEWARLIESYFSHGEPHVIQLVDAKVGATPLDVEAFEYLEAVGRSPLVVATKSDKVPRSKRFRQLAEIAGELGMAEGQPVTAVSAKTGEGIPALWGRIEEALGSPAQARSAHRTTGVSHE